MSGPWKERRKEIRAEAEEEMGIAQQARNPALEPLHPESFTQLPINIQTLLNFIHCKEEVMMVFSHGCSEQ